MTDIASALRLARVEAGLTLREAAETSGLNKDVISRIERGRQHPQALTVGKLARAYGREPAEFLGGVEYPKDRAPGPPREWLRAHNARLLSLTEEELSDIFAALYSDDSAKFADRINKEWQAVEMARDLAEDPDAQFVQEAYAHAASRYLQATELAPISTSYDPDDPEKPEQVTLRFDTPEMPARTGREDRSNTA